MKKSITADFEKLRSDGDAAFAVAVGEVAAGHRKENKWKREKRADHEHEKIALARGEIGGDDDVNDEELQRVVVERRLELGDDQAPEAALPTIGRRLLRGHRIVQLIRHERLFVSACTVLQIR